jgi:hypothetical protein
MAANYIFWAFTGQLPAALTAIFEDEAKLKGKLTADEIEWLAGALWHEFETGLAITLVEGRINKYVRNEFGYGLDDLWQRCGFGDKAEAPRRSWFPLRPR